MEVWLSFDLPPSVNKLYKRWRDKVVLTDEARAYKEATMLQARGQYKGEPLEGALYVEVWIYGGKLDIDNGNKALLNSLNGTIWIDDKQIIDLCLHRRPDDGDARVDMLVRGSE